MAGKLQTKLDTPTACAEGVQTAAGEATCFDILYKIKSTEKSHAEIAKGMTAAWYAQKDNYDFTTGLPTGTNKAGKANTYAEVAGLTAMLWKGAVGTTDYAVFAVHAGCAAARFCLKINEGTVPVGGVVDQPSTSVNYKTNVFKQCVNKDGVDFCYAES